MENTFPTFSVVVPFFNNQETLKRAVTSVFNQTYSNWELVLVNDGSSDNSINCITHLLKNERIKLINQENSGVTISRNKGAELASGKWLIFLDADDELLNNALENFKRFIEEKGEKLKIIKAGYSKFRSGLSQDFIPSETVSQSFLSGSFAIKKELFDQLLGYDIRLKFSENAELHHRLSLNKEPVGYLGLVVLIYHESITGGSKNLQNMIDSLTYILEKHSSTLEPNVKHLYQQIIGVNWMRFRNFQKARYHFLEAIKYRPSKLATWARLGLAYFPFLAKQLYSETVNYG